jgi:hypothetical protein
MDAFLHPVFILCSSCDVCFGCLLGEETALLMDISCMSLFPTTRPDRRSPTQSQPTAAELS